MDEKYNNNQFWINNPSIFLQNNNYLNFIPTSNMTYIQKLNSLSLFFIYLLILMILFERKTKFIYVPIIGLSMIFIIYYLYTIDPESKNKEFERFNIIKPLNKYESDDNIYELDKNYYDSNGQVILDNVYSKKNNNKKVKFEVNELLEYEKATCRKSTKDNPFMNPPVTDFNNGDKPEACNANDEDIKENIEYNFNADLYRDIEDLFNVKNSQRQFYTIPNTSIPNNQVEFANWLYKTEDTCKEDQLQCLRYEDLRFKR